MLLESASIEKIVTKNLLQVTVTDTQLNSNFAYILKALRSHDSMLNEHQQKITAMDKRMQYQVKMISENE